MAMEGINSQQITIPSQDIYRIQVAIFGQGINDQTYAGLAEGILELGSGVVTTPKQEPIPETLVPGWIKTTTGFWVSDLTSDNEFVQAIEFLINNDIIIIPPTSGGSSGSTEIPSWIKTTAGFWVDGFSTDKEFVAAIQFLIKEGIMKID